MHARTYVRTHKPTHFFSCEIPLGDIQSEEERDIVLELKLPVLPSPQPDTALVTTLSYFNVITSALDTLTTELTVNRTGTCMLMCIHATLNLEKAESLSICVSRLE